MPFQPPGFRVHRSLMIGLSCIVAICAACSIAAAARSRPTESGLVARWTFDRMVQGKTPDTSGQFPATIQNADGAVCIRREGDRSFISIPGTNPKDCVTLGSGTAFDLPRVFTLEAWFRPYPAPDRHYTMILGKRYNHQFQLTWTSSAGGTVEFYVGGGDLRKNRCWKSGIRTGRWLHVVAVYNAETATGPNQWLYVNGRLARAVRNPVHLTPDNAPLRIAQNSTMTLDNRVPADWDEVAVCNRAWSAQEVAVAYSRKQPAATRIAGESWNLPLGTAESWREVETPQTGRAGVQVDRMAGAVVSKKDAIQGGIEVESAAASGLVFRVQGRPPRSARGVWRLRLPGPVDLNAFRYCLVRYRARGLERAVSPLPVLAFEGESDRTVAVTSSHLVLDGRPHTCLAKVDFSAPVESVAVELRTRGTTTEFRLDQVMLLRTPQIVLPAPASPGGDSRLVPISLPNGLSRSLPNIVDAALSGLGTAVHDPPFPAGAGSARPLEPAIPFATRVDGTVLWPGETEDNDRLVNAFGQEVSRASFFPNARDGVLEVPIHRSVAEVFLLLACDLPALEKRYSLPPVPWGITDVEALDIELVYADGAAEFAFPWSIREHGFRVLGPLEAYAVAVDPKRTLERVRLHNRMHGFSVGIAAVTINTGPRRFPELAADPPPTPVPTPIRMSPAPPTVKAAQGILTLDNGVCGLTVDCRDGFSLCELRNHLAGKARYALAPTSGIEVQARDKLLTGSDFALTRLAVDGPRARVELASKTPDVPLALVLELEMGTGPEVRMSIRVRNTGQTGVQADIRFPVLNRLVLGAVGDTWMFFPQYRNVLTREVCWCRQPNHRGFPLQFMDVFNPVAGGGVGLLTRNMEAEPVIYCLTKRSDGATAAIESRGEDFPLAGGAEVRLCDRVLAIHGGDWHEAARLYRNWHRANLRPIAAQDKPRFRHAVWIRSHIASPKNAKNISHTPPLYDPGTHRWRTDAFLEADQRLLGLRPDMFHFYVWAFNDSLDGDVARDGEYGPKDYANLGGLGSFRAAIEHIRNDRKLPVSLYTIWDRCNRDTDFFRTWGDRFAKMRSSGEREVASSKVYISQGVPEWRRHAAQTLQRLQKDTGADVIYLDVFGTDDRARDYNPNAGHAHVPAWVAREDAEFLEAVRQAVPKRVALWGEFPTTDVGSRYWDGCLMYDCIPLHEYLAKAEDRLETAPGWSRDTLPPNVLRFVWPHLRQVVFPVGTEGTVDNWRFLKFLLFNGQALFDTTWRLYDARCRERLGRALRLQRQYMDCFDADAPEMFVPTLRGHVFANWFPGKGRAVWTVFNGRCRTVKGPILEVPHLPGAVYRDLWNGRALHPEIRSGRAVVDLALPPQGIGCVLQTVPKTGR